LIQTIRNVGYRFNVEILTPSPVGQSPSRVASERVTTQRSTVAGTFRN